MTVKTFRGLMADGAQDTIVLHTNDGSTGYRVVKFKLFSPTPGVTGQESVVKIYKIPQTAVDGLIDFSDNTLLGSAFISSITGNPSVHPETVSVIFDNEVFNQDIYITHSEVNGSAACNYYIELEQVKLDLGQNTVATLIDIRNITQPGPIP